MHFVISSLATLKSSVEYDDIWCGKKKTIKVNDKMLNDTFQDNRNTCSKKKMYDIFGNKK